MKLQGLFVVTSVSDENSASSLLRKVKILLLSPVATAGGYDSGGGVGGSGKPADLSSSCGSGSLSYYGGAADDAATVTNFAG